MSHARVRAGPRADDTWGAGGRREVSGKCKERVARGERSEDGADEAEAGGGRERGLGKGKGEGTEAGLSEGHFPPHFHCFIFSKTLGISMYYFK